MSRTKTIEALLEQLDRQNQWAGAMDVELRIDTQVEINKELLRMVNALAKEVAELKASRWEHGRIPTGPRKR